MRATLLNLMVDALLDFRAIAFLTSIPLLTTTLVSTRPPVLSCPPPPPLPYLLHYSRGSFTHPRFALIARASERGKTVPRVIRKMPMSARRLLIAMYTVAVRLIAAYTPIGACLDWRKGAQGN